MKGRRVVVEEPGKVWEGVLLTTKPSSVSGVWGEVLSDDGSVWAVPLRYVQPLDDDEGEETDGAAAVE